MSEVYGEKRDRMGCTWPCAGYDIPGKLKGKRKFGQANKCTGWMPRHEPAKKDVASCEKLRGAASEQRSGDVRMGKPGGSSPVIPRGKPTRGTETSKYPEEEKSNEIP